jgi:DNA-binding protein HU-beta
MNTADLIDQVSKKFKKTKAEAKAIVNFLTERVIVEVKKGNDVKLSGFGLFYKASRKARNGRNPQNGEPVKIPATKVPRFKPGKKFKEAVK